MGAASAFTVTTSFAALTTTPGLPTATASTTPAMPVTAMAAAGVKHLAEHPNERTMQAARNITETGVHFTDSIVACNVCKIKKGTKQPIHNKPDKTEIPERLQLFSTDILEPVTPAARGNYRFLVKCSDHYTKFKAVYLFLKKDKSLATLVKLVQDFVIPLRLGLLHLRADSGGDFTVDYYHDYCKTTMIIQQFSSPNTSEQNGLSERDGPVYTKRSSARFWGKMAATAVFLLNCPLSKSIGGNTSYYKMFSKHVDLLFFQTIGTRPHEGRQANLVLTSRHIRFPLHLQSKQQFRAHWLL